MLVFLKDNCYRFYCLETAFSDGTNLPPPRSQKFHISPPAAEKRTKRKGSGLWSELTGSNHCKVINGHRFWLASIASQSVISQNFPLCGEIL